MIHAHSKKFQKAQKCMMKRLTSTPKFPAPPFASGGAATVTCSFCIVAEMFHNCAHEWEWAWLCDGMCVHHTGEVGVWGCPLACKAACPGPLWNGKFSWNIILMCSYLVMFPNMGGKEWRTKYSELCARSRFSSGHSVLCALCSPCWIWWSEWKTTWYLASVVQRASLKNGDSALCLYHAFHS